MESKRKLFQNISKESKSKINLRKKWKKIKKTRE